MEQTIHMIGNAHIDPAWMWRWPDGFSEVKATFRSALDRMEEYDDFIFTCGASLYYQWVEENEPEMFEQIRRRVREGRWVLVGGWLIQPDCNLPSGESFVRHSLYGQRYFLEKFGRCARVGYNVDSFGHSAMLPQILKKSGMDSYVMMRPQAYELPLPGCRFWWEAPDGSRVRTFRIPTCYNNADHSEQEDPFLKRHRSFLELTKDEPGTLMEFYGVGNHGGGPTRRNIDTLHQLQKAGGPNIVFSSPDAFFDTLEAEQMELPVVKGELQHHASGCYSAYSSVKRDNRRAEQVLIEAESLSALCAGLLGDSRDNQAQIHSGWKKVLFNQFHDIMGGCSIRDVYRDAGDYFGYACTIGEDEANHAAQRIAWHIDTMGQPAFPLSKDQDGILWEMQDRGVPVVVFNTHAWEVTAPVQIDRNLAGVTDDKGCPVPIQLVRSPRGFMPNIWDTVFQATVPPLGYRVYWCYCSKETRAPAASVQADSGALSIENEYLRVSFDAATGTIREWLDKQSGRKLFRGAAARAVVIDESNVNTWGQWMYCWDKALCAFADARVRVMECGPVRARVRVESSCGNNTLRQDFILYAGAQALEVQGRVLWQERHRMLKLQFPLNGENIRSFYQIPYGMLERPANGEEEPCQQWMDVCGTAPDGAGIGAAILNTGCQSGCVRPDGVMGFTVLRSPIFAEARVCHMGVDGQHDSDADCMEQGEHFFTYTILQHSFDGTPAHTALLTREAAVRNRSFRVCKETYHPGPLGQRYSGLRISSEQVAVGALKRGEDGGGWILRLRETTGYSCVTEVDVPLLNRKVTLSFGPQEIKTLLLPDDPSLPVQETDLLERPM